MSIRTEKVSSAIKRILAQPINDIAKSNGDGLVTVTDVQISKDLQVAKVYVSVYNSKDGASIFLELLESKKGILKSQIAAQLRLRFTPDLRFFLDDTLDKIVYIQTLLDSVRNPLEQTNEE